MDRNFLNAWSEVIFKSLQPQYDGGIFTPLTQGEQFHLNETLLWLRHLFFRPYYNVTIVLGAIWILLVPLLLLLLLCCFCQTNCFCCFACVRHMRRGVNAVGRRCCGRKQLIRELPTRPLTYKGDTEKHRATGANLLCCFLCLIILCAALYYTMSESEQVQNFLSGEDNTTKSFGDYKDAAIQEVQDFLRDGVSDANATSMAWILEFNSFLKGIMSDFVKSLSNDLYTRFGIYPTLDEAEAVLARITTVFNAMQFINDHHKSIIQNASFFVGKISAVKNIIEEELKVQCPSFTSPEECFEVLNMTSGLENGIRWNAIDFDTSTSIISLMKRQNFNLNFLTAEARNSREIIKFYINYFHEDALKMVTKANLLKEVPKIWNTVDTAVNDVVISFLDNLITERPEQPYLDEAVRLWRIIANLAWSVCLTFGILVFITWIFAVIKIGYSRSAAKRRSPREKYAMNLQSLFANMKTANVDVAAEKMSQASDAGGDEALSSMLIYGPLRCLHSVSGVVLVIPCAITIAAFLLSGLLTTEVCRYMVDSAGVEVADEKLDDVVGRLWDENVAQINLTAFVDLKRPSHVLKGIFLTCRHPNMSIIESLGMTGILNATKFSKSPMFNQLIEQGYAATKKSFAALPLDNMIPTAVNKYIDDGITLLEKFVDGKDYKPSIAVLNEPILKITNYPDYVRRLHQLSTNIPDDNLKRYVGVLERSIPLHNALQTEVTKLRTQFENLDNPSLAQQLRDLKILIKTTFDSMKNQTATNSVLASTYNALVGTMIERIVVQLQKDIEILERSLFKCQQLHRAYSISMRAICGDLRSGLGSFSLALAINALAYQLCFLFSWCLVSGLKPPSTSDDSSDC